MRIMRQKKMMKKVYKNKLDEKCIIKYEEYLNKMKNMADESKVMENNMKQFSNQIQNLLNTST